MSELHSINVRKLLAQYHAISARQFKGDYDAVIALVDLADASSRAGFTERQAEALALVYGEDLTQADAGERMGIGQEAVSQLITVAERNLQKIYDRWAEIGE